MISFIVLRTANMADMLKFYTAIGMAFVEEQHGSSPVHYAATLEGIVLEIYPAESGSAPEPKSGGATMIGFKISSLENVLARLAAHDFTPKSAPKNGRVTILDPDGRLLELREE